MECERFKNESTLVNVYLQRRREKIDTLEPIFESTHEDAIENKFCLISSLNLKQFIHGEPSSSKQTSEENEKCLINLANDIDFIDCSMDLENCNSDSNLGINFPFPSAQEFQKNQELLYCEHKKLLISKLCLMKRISKTVLSCNVFSLL